MTKSSITVRTDPDTLERLDRLAGTLDRSRNDLVNQALRVYLHQQARQIEEIEAGLAELDKGEGVPHQLAMADLEARLAEKAG